MKSFILSFLMMVVAGITYVQDVVSWHYSAQAMYATSYREIQYFFTIKY